MTWLHRMFGPGSFSRLHRPHWLGRLLHPSDRAEVYEAQEARRELSTLLREATKEADAIMAKINQPKAGHHG